MDALITFTNFTPWLFYLICAACGIAGIVRGFTGFGLSAVAMAILTAFVAPVELLPIMLLLEAAASLFLLRGTWRDADFGMIGWMFIGSIIGYPIGLTLTVSVSVEISKFMALGIILVLVLANLSGRMPPLGRTKFSLVIAGFTASFASGIAGVGGLVLALVYLSLQLEPRVMRATMVVHLLVSLVMSISYQLWFGVMDGQAIERSAVLIPVTLVGVWIGKLMFQPSAEKYYRRVCMIVLVIVTVLGMLRTAF